MMVKRENEDLITDYCLEFIAKIESQKNTFNKVSSEILLYISELINTEFQTKAHERIANLIVKEYIKKIELGEIINKGMLYEFGIFTFSVNNIYRKTGELSKIKNSLNNYILNSTDNLVEKYISSSVNMRFYDCISGVSGVLYYLLDTDINLLDLNKIENLINYLIQLTENKCYKGKRVINYHITKDIFSRYGDEMLFPNGNINFGISHGMMGPLLALTKAYDMFGYNKILEAIKILLDIYEQFSNNEKGILYYPTQLPLENYLEKRNNKFYNNAGWCYGNISIVLGLMKVYKTLKDKEKYHYYMTHLLNIINQDLKSYLLEYPVICHGFTSVVAEQISSNRITADDRFLINLDRNVSAVIQSYNEWNNIYKKKNTFEVRKDIGIQGHKDDLTFLTGSGGIFLNFFNILTSQNSYEKLLMID